MTSVIPEQQRQLALDVLRRLREAGYQALWAGGCVRDQLLGRVPHDYDVATCATPPEIRKIFGRGHTLEIGAAFGVVAVKGRKSAGMVEVTTFRRDTQYSDGRHPDAVVFSTAEEDAQRRDFTINGLFYDPVDERVIDYVDGLADIERGLVRAIGDPRERFAEDKLRMVRAVRIAAGFDFALDERTQAAIEEMADTINVVSSERIAQEMRKMLVHARRVDAVEHLRRTRLLGALAPELLELLPDAAKSSSAAADGSYALGRWQHTLLALQALVEPSFPLALAALVHALGERETEPPQEPAQSMPNGGEQDQAERAAIAICDRWRLSNKERDRTTWLVAHHGRLAGAADQPWSAIQPLLIAPGGAELVALHEADGKASSSADTARADADFCRAKLALPAEELNPPPLLSGNDLVDHGVPKGAIFKLLLDKARQAQLDGKVHDRREALALVDRLLGDDAPG